MSRPIDVTGIGNALVDIQVRIDDDKLASLGFDKGIMTLVDDVTQAKILDGLKGVDVTRCAGGSSANSIAAAAQIGSAGAYIGKVGDDEIGRFYVDDLRRLGIEITTAPSDVPTGTSFILITPDAQRTMLTSLGAAATIGPDDIDADLIRRSRFVYIEGYLLTAPSGRAAAEHAMEIAAGCDCRVALTASDPFLVDLLRDDLWKLLEGPVDLFFCNEEEAKSLTGKDDPVECAAEIHRHVADVAMTLGPNGSILMRDGETIAVGGVPVEAIDTTGAGDVYAGALLAGVAAGKDLASAGRLASHFAGRVVSQLGARCAEPPSDADVHRWMAG